MRRWRLWSSPRVPLSMVLWTLRRPLRLLRGLCVVVVGVLFVCCWCVVCVWLLLVCCAVLLLFFVLFVCLFLFSHFITLLFSTQQTKIDLSTLSLKLSLLNSNTCSPSLRTPRKEGFFFFFFFFDYYSR